MRPRSGKSQGEVDTPQMRLAFVNNIMATGSRKFLTGTLLVSIACSLYSGAFAQSSARLANQAKADAIAAAVGNGIHVDTAKVYDDTALQLMLNAARQRLATLQSFDQAALTTRIGAVTGASLDQRAISAQVLGPTIPGSTVSDLGATGSTTTVNAPTGQTTTNVAGQPVQNVVANNPQMSATAPGLPTLTSALPTGGFNISSLDALGEMMQLTYEIANLQLLLEGSLSDRYVRGERITKPRTTLGFTISVSTQERFKDAVAIVEVDVERPTENNFAPAEPPGVTALLPREKTYNVAAITDNMTQVGGGIVSQVINGGFTFLRGRKTYYLVQDQDTLAMMRPGAAGRSAFAWQFRPVLGQRYAKSGLKQTFVQLAVPVKAMATSFGKIKVRTYWQRYDRKRGVLKDIIPESIDDSYVDYEIPVFDSSPVIQNVTPQDVGGGALQTAVEGRFLAGTYVRVGSNFYREGSPGFTSELTQIRFTANAADIARHGAFLITRDGTETPIQLQLRPTRAAGSPALTTATSTISAYDATHSLVNVSISGLPSNAPPIESYVMVVNGRVYGLSDSPIERASNSRRAVLRALVPTNVLLPATEVVVKPLFWDPAFSMQTGRILNLENSLDRIVTLGKLLNGKTRYLLYGSRLQSAHIIVPEGVTLQALLSNSDDDTLQAFDLTAEQAAGLKTIVLVKDRDRRPVFVPMPGPEPKPTVTARSRISVGTEELIVTSDHFDRLKAAKFRNVDMLDGHVRDKANITLTNLSRKGVTSTPGNKKIEFDFGDLGKFALEIEVVTGKVEVLLPGS